MINKTIYSIWLNEEKALPGLVAKCLASQELQGYEHRVITFDDEYVVIPLDNVIITFDREFSKIVRIKAELEKMNGTE